MQQALDIINKEIKHHKARQERYELYIDTDKEEHQEYWREQRRLAKDAERTLAVVRDEIEAGL